MIDVDHAAISAKKIGASPQFLPSPPVSKRFKSYGNPWVNPFRTVLHVWDIHLHLGDLWAKCW